MQTVQSSEKAPQLSQSIGHGLMRDWQRWTWTERVTAGCMLAIIVLGVSIFILSAFAAQPA